MEDLKGRLDSSVSSNGRAATDLSSVAKNFAFLAGIYLYFVGWVYLYLYYKHFGVHILGLDIPLTFFFVYSFPVVTTGLTGTKALVFAIIVLMIALAVMNSSSRIWKAMMLFLTLSLFAASFGAAKQSAESNAINFRQGYGARVVQFRLNTEKKETFPAKFMEANENRELLLLLETKDRFYVVYQPAGPKEELPMASTYSIAREHVVIADVDVTNASVKD